MEGLPGSAPHIGADLAGARQMAANRKHSDRSSKRKPDQSLKTPTEADLLA